MKRIILAVVPALMLGCSAPAPVAMAAQAGESPVTATSRGEPSLARLVGRVAYPSEYLPPMRVCALAADDPGTAHCLRTAENEPHYGISVPAGAWVLLAWPQDTGTAGDPGLLSEASECIGTGGLGCDDHALRVVTVAAGEHRDGLDINDWYYDPRESLPPMEPRGTDADQ